MQRELGRGKTGAWQQMWPHPAFSWCCIVKVEVAWESFQWLMKLWTLALVLEPAPTSGRLWPSLWHVRVQVLSWAHLGLPPDSTLTLLFITYQILAWYRTSCSPIQRNGMFYIQTCLPAGLTEYVGIVIFLGEWDFFAFWGCLFFFNLLAFARNYQILCLVHAC